MPELKRASRSDGCKPVKDAGLKHACGCSRSRYRPSASRLPLWASPALSALHPLTSHPLSSIRFYDLTTFTIHASFPFLSLSLVLLDSRIVPCASPDPPTSPIAPQFIHTTSKCPFLNDPLDFLDDLVRLILLFVSQPTLGSLLGIAARESSVDS